MYAVNASGTRSAIAAMATGTTRQRVSRRHLGSVVIPIPPLSEQGRIASVLDEAVALHSRITSALAGIKKRMEALEGATCSRLWEAGCASGAVAPVNDHAVVTGGLQKSPARRAVQGAQ